MLVETLKRSGVGRIFALSGNQVLPIFDAAIDAGVEMIHVRHEAAAVHMADAWARLTGSLGVALVAAGPAHGNALSALLSALEAESPVLLISGQSPSMDGGAGGFQHAPHAEMAKPMTKWSRTISAPGDIEREIAEALRIALSGRPGPVHIGVPIDVLEASAQAGGQAPTPENGSQGAPTLRVGAISDFLASCDHPLFIAGPAMKRKPEVLRRITEVLGVPVIATESPRGVADPSLGRYSQVLSEADGVVLLGKRLDWSLGFAEAFDSGCRFVQIDADQAELDRTAELLSGSARLVQSIHVDPALAAWGLVSPDGLRFQAWSESVARAVAYRRPEWRKVSSAAGEPIHPAELCRAIQPWLDRQSIHVSDGGEFGQWAQAMLDAPHRVINGPAGAIGASVPFAIAAKQARPFSRVIATVGDGSFGFHAMEFDTAVRYGVPFVAIIGNDARWNTEYERQLRRKGARYATGLELLPTRYEKLVEALGGHGEFVPDAAGLDSALQRAFASEKPSCVNVLIAPTRAPEIGEYPTEDRQ